jgi:cobalt transporter subunit CbtB
MESTMTETTHTTTSGVAGTRSATRSLLLQLAAGAALGLVVLYGVAFAESPLMHNAAHDVRHITVKPCH